MRSFVRFILVIATSLVRPRDAICLCQAAADQDASGHGLWNDTVTVVVDMLTGCDCREQTLQQNIICNDITTVLDLLSQDPSTTSVELIINQGSYVVEGTYTIAKDVFIRGREGHSVLVQLQTQGSSPPMFIYSLSFKNTDFVSVQNIDFSGSNGVIGFDNVSVVEVSSSSFR